MRTVLEDRSAFRAEQLRPAGRVAAFLGSQPLRRFGLVRHLHGTALSDPVHGEELNRKAGRAKRKYFVFHIGRDGLDLSRTQDNVDLRLGRSSKAQPTITNHNPSPRATGHPVCPKKPRWHGVLSPLGSGSHHPETVRQLRSVTQRALEWSPETRIASHGVRYPPSELKWRAMADVLIVAA